MKTVSDKIFCEWCNKTLNPINYIEVKMGIEKEYVYEHEDMPHGNIEEIGEYIHELQ